MKSPIFIILLGIALATVGCGRKRQEPPPPPVAIKGVRFGASVSDVQRRFKDVKKVSDAFGLAYYMCPPPDPQSPVTGYRFEFIDGKLSACDVVYDAPRFDKAIVKEDFFQQIERKYDAKPDLGTPQGVWRWFNVRDGITITWREDFRRKVYQLRISWDKMDDVRRARMEAIARAARKKTEPAKAPKPHRPDLGI